MTILHTPRIKTLSGLGLLMAAAFAFFRMPEISLDFAECPCGYLRDGSLQIILKQWHTTSGGLYFVTPSARARPAKVQALAEFFVKKFAKPVWS